MEMDRVGNVRPVAIEDEMRTAYIDYAMSVIVARALPDVRDGLKPVHRRILSAMHDLGLRLPRRTRSAPASSARRWQVPPARRPGPLRDPRAHGPGLQPALSARPRPGQLRLHRRRPARGHRYTEARLSRSPTSCSPTSRRTRSTSSTTTTAVREPIVLPAKLPNLLVNGSRGIAVGMATEIPPHNLREVAAAIVALIDNPDWRRGPDRDRHRPGLPDRRHIFRYQDQRNSITGA